MALRWRLMITLVVGAVLVARSASAGPTLLLVEDGGAGSDILHRFKDGTLSTVGPIGYKDVRGLAWDGVPRQLYGVSRLGLRLLRVNPATGTGAEVAPNLYLPTGSNTAEMTATAGGIIYGAGHIGDQTTVDTLLTVDKVTGMATSVGLFGGPLLSGLAVDDSTAVLYGTTFLGELYTVDATTGAAAHVGDITGTNGTAARIAFDQEAHLLFAITTANQLVTIDLTSLVATEVAQFVGLNQLYSMDFAPRCGDGQLDLGETCDGGDCCSATCDYEAASIPCTADASLCTADVCDGAGTCMHTFPMNAGCQDALATKASVQIKKNADPAKDKVTWKWKSSGSVAKTDFGDPTGTTTLALCVADGAGNLLLDLETPAGGACGAGQCWTETTTGYKYKDKLLDPDGLLSAGFKEGAAGQGKITVKGKGANLATPALPVASLPVRARVVRSDGAACWESTHAVAIENDGVQFTAK